VYNRVILVGRLGSDPVVKTTASGQTVANFSVATTNKFTDRDGVKQEVTEWTYVVAWHKLADICGQYLRKGSLVLIEGSLSTKKWAQKDNPGKFNYRTEVNCREMKMLGDRRDSTTTDAYEPAADNAFEDVHQDDEDSIPF